MKLTNPLKTLTVLFTISFFIFATESCLRNNPDRNESMDEVKPYPHTIDMRQGFNNASRITLSEIADSIQYVVLSKDKQKLIGNVSKIQITDNNIYLISSNEGIVLRFSLTGKFQNSFGSIGRGPKEYLRGSLFTTTPDDDRLIIFKSAMDSYLIFETNGNYIETRDFPVSRTLYDFRNLSDSVFLCTFYYIGSIMKDYISNFINCSAGLFDLDGNPIKLIEHPLKNADISDSDIGNIISMAPSITFFDNRIVLKPAGDTIYEIDSNSITKGYIIDWGNIPHKKSIKELFFFQAEPSDKPSIGSFVLETYDKTYFRVLKGNESIIFEYDKITGTVESMIEDPNNRGFINDLDGGENYFPDYTNRKGDIWITSEDAYSFKEKHSPEFLDKSIAINPEMKENLKTFTNNLKQDDNPVLKIVYLKKHPR